MKTPFHSICDLLEGGTDCVAAQILSTLGSVPRSAGSRMIFPAGDSSIGTIGGGTLEARVLEIATGVLCTGEAKVESFVLTTKNAADLGMLCGGSLEMLIFRIEARDEEARALYRGAAAILDGSGEARFITRIPGENDRLAQWLARNDGTVLGPPEPMGGLPAAAAADGPRIVSAAGSRFLVEPLRGGVMVCLFGAGHIARALAAILDTTGFHTSVFDDREDFASAERFPGAEHLVLIDRWDLALEGLDAGPGHFLVIVTRGHAFDREVLRQALRTDAGYIGMISSRRKRDAIFATLREEGFTEEDLQRVHAPIGLPIGAETPEEIAISIAAELIRHRAEKKL